MLEGHDRRILCKGAFICPVRKVFLPRDHWAIPFYDETKNVCADTPAGFGLIDLSNIAWY
jgi:hypothetical protein